MLGMMKLMWLFCFSCDRMDQAAIKIPGSSRVPVVRLERLKIRVKPGFLSKPPVDGEIGPGADPALKRELATTEDPRQNLSTKVCPQRAPILFLQML